MVWLNLIEQSNIPWIVHKFFQIKKNADTVNKRRLKKKQ